MFTIHFNSICGPWCECVLCVLNFFLILKIRRYVTNLEFWKLHFICCRLLKFKINHNARALIWQKKILLWFCIKSNNQGNYLSKIGIENAGWCIFVVKAWAAFFFFLHFCWIQWANSTTARSTYGQHIWKIFQRNFPHPEQHLNIYMHKHSVSTEFHLFDMRKHRNIIHPNSFSVQTC